MRKIRVTVGTVGYYDAKHAHKTSSLLVSLNTSAAQSK